MRVENRKYIQKGCSVTTFFKTFCLQRQLKHLQSYEIFNELVATEVYNDVLFVSEKDENVWWYDGERIAFFCKFEELDEYLKEKNYAK